MMSPYFSAIISLPDNSLKENREVLEEETFGGKISAFSSSIRFIKGPFMGIL